MRAWLTATMAALIALPCSTAFAQDSSAQTATDKDAKARYATAIKAYNSKDFATAAPLLIQLCRQGYAQTCSVAGSLAANGQGMDQNIAEALVLFDRGCSGKRVDSCRNAATVYAEAAKPFRSQEQAAKYEKKACDLSDFRSCQKLGYRYVTGVGVAKDRDAAFSLSTKACDGGNGAGCADLGRLYLPFPKNQDKGPQYDLTKAIENYRKACDLKDGRGCALLAEKYETGLGVEKDTDKALELYRLALTFKPEQWVRNSTQGAIDRLRATKSK